MPTPPDLAWLLSDQIGHAYAIITNAAREQLADEEVTVAEFVALVVLTEFPDGLTQTAWGQCQGVTRQRAHTISNKLSAAGLIEIARLGRSSIVKPSRAGASLVRRLRPRLSTGLVRCLGNLSRQDAKELSRLLAKLLPAVG